MSEKHPNVNDVLRNSTGIEEMRKHLCRSYLNLAKQDFWRKNNRHAILTDAQELYDIYEAQWRDYYIDKPIREAENKKVGEPIWRYGKSLGIDVYDSMCRFLESTYPAYRFTVGGEMYNAMTAARVCEEKGIEFMETYIMNNDLLESYKKFVSDHRNTLKKYFKPTYTDYSHLAYNGVTDDF